MRDNRYTNMWGEGSEEQEKRREWLRGVYDRATQPEQTQQSTPMPSQSEQMALQDNANINYNQPAATQNHSGESDPGRFIRLAAMKWKTIGNVVDFDCFIKLLRYYYCNFLT